MHSYVFYERREFCKNFELFIAAITSYSRQRVEKKSIAKQHGKENKNNLNGIVYMDYCHLYQCSHFFFLNYIWWCIRMRCMKLTYNL